MGKGDFLKHLRYYTFFLLSALPFFVYTRICFKRLKRIHQQQYTRAHIHYLFGAYNTESSCEYFILFLWHSARVLRITSSIRASSHIYTISISVKRKKTEYVCWWLCVFVLFVRIAYTISYKPLLCLLCGCKICHIPICCVGIRRGN